MSDDAMVLIAVLFSRSEALSVAAMLDSAGIIAHVGGEYYAGTTLNIIAMGGFRVTVPAWQHQDASDILSDFADQPVVYSTAIRRRALPLLAIIGLTILLPVGYLHHRAGDLTLGTVLMLTLSLSATPLAPQVRGEYYLSAARVD